MRCIKETFSGAVSSHRMSQVHKACEFWLCVTIHLARSWLYCVSAEKDTEREANLGEDLRQQVVEFVDKGEARIDKERSRWREALDRDVQLRIPHAKFRLLLKAEKEKKKLEKKRQEDKEKAEANGEQPDTGSASTTRETTELGERTHTDRGDQHPGWIRPGLATRVLRVRYAHQLWEHHAHLWDRANSFWDKVKIGIAKAKAVQRSSWLHPTLQEGWVQGLWCWHQRSKIQVRCQQDTYVREQRCNRNQQEHAGWLYRFTAPDTSKRCGRY